MYPALIRNPANSWMATDKVYHHRLSLLGISRLTIKGKSVGALLIELQEWIKLFVAVIGWRGRLDQLT